MSSPLFSAVRLLNDVASGTGIDPLTALSQLGIGALIAAPFAYMWRSVRADAESSTAACRQDIAAKDAELREVRAEMYRRERDLNDAALPRLVDSITTLRDTQRGMGDVLHRTQGPAPDLMLGEIARKLEAAVEALTDFRRRDK